MIALLDLNYTLVENSIELSRKGWEFRQKNERYRKWLIDIINTMGFEKVILITVRPKWQQEWTLENIKEKLGWEPEITFQELVREMVQSDLMEARRRLAGLNVTAE